MLEQLQDVCNELKDENEIAIIEKYGSKAKYYTTTIIRKTMVDEYFICSKNRLNIIINIFFSKRNKISSILNKKIGKLNN